MRLWGIDPDRNAASNNLPPSSASRAQCFNRIDLPRYTSYEETHRYLHLIIQMELTGFGME